MKKIGTVIVVLLVMLCTACTQNTIKTGKVEEMPKDFSFRLTWNCYGVSSYDSATGKLVKTTDATNPEDYVTYYYLTDEEKQEIYELIEKLHVDKYPDTYNPHDNLMSSPSWTIILTVCENGEEKTIEARDIAMEKHADNIKGQRFLDTCLGIRDILVETDEWEALPDYEVLYE